VLRQRAAQRNDWVVYNSVMEMANREKPAVRVANSGDKRAIIRLIRGAPFCHIHADWRLPVDWLGWPEFLLYEGNDKDGDLVACLAATADPLPAAWVRIAAAADGQEAAGLCIAGPGRNRRQAVGLVAGPTLA